MEQYNKVLKNVLESNKLKHLVELEESQRQELEKFKIIKVSSDPSDKYTSFLNIKLSSETIVELNLRKAFNVNDSSMTSELIIDTGEERDWFISHIEKLFPDLVEETNSKGTQLLAIVDFFQTIFKSIYILKKTGA